MAAKLRRYPYVNVTTPHGAMYRIHVDTGRLTYHRRHDESGSRMVQGSHQWVILGISYTDQRFGGLITGGLTALFELATLPPGDLLYRNGKPRYTLVDLDHGTRRTHGNTEHHGIQSVTNVRRVRCAWKVSR